MRRVRAMKIATDIVLLGDASKTLACVSSSMYKRKTKAFTCLERSPPIPQPKFRTATGRERVPARGHQSSEQPYRHLRARESAEVGNSVATPIPEPVWMEPAPFRSRFGSRYCCERLCFFGSTGHVILMLIDAWRAAPAEFLLSSTRGWSYL